MQQHKPVILLLCSLFCCAWCWFYDTTYKYYGLGYNEYSQLFNRTITARTVNTVHLGFVAKQISAGTFHSLVLAENGTLFGCGYPAFGSLGRISGKFKISSLVTIPFEEAFDELVQVKALYTMAITRSRKLVAFGDNRQDATGIPTETSYVYDPTYVRGGLVNRRVKWVAAGQSHVLVITEDGALFAHGSNSHGQLGINSTVETILEPTLMNATFDGSITSIHAGGQHSIVVVNYDTLYVFGNNVRGQLGLGYMQHKVLYPLKLKQFPNKIVNVQLGESFSALLLDNGIVYTCGREAGGALGRNTDTNENNNVFGPVLIDFPVKYLASGTDFTFAFSNTSFAAVAWGSNDNNELRIGTQTSYKYPETVEEDLSSVNEISACTTHVLAIDKSRTVLKSWGSSRYGQLLRDSRFFVPTKRELDVPQGLYHFSVDFHVLMYNSSFLMGWGKNSYGELSMDSTALKIDPYPILIRHSQQVVDVCSAAFHSLFIVRADKQQLLYASGSNSEAQLGLSPLQLDAREFARPVKFTDMLPGEYPVKSSCNYYSSQVITNFNRTWVWGNTEVSRPLLINNSLLNGSITHIAACYECWFVVVDHTRILVLFDSTNKRFFRSKSIYLQDNIYLEPVTGFPLGEVVDIFEAGYRHAIIFTKSKQLFSFGYDQFGARCLGYVKNIASLDDVFMVTPVATGDINAKDVVSISVGSYHNLFITSDNTVFACGENSMKQFGETGSDRHDTIVKVHELDGLTVLQAYAGGFSSIVAVVHRSTTILGVVVTLLSIFVGIALIVGIALGVCLCVTTVIRNKRMKEQINEEAQALLLEFAQEHTSDFASRFNMTNQIAYSELSHFVEIGAGGSGTIVFKASWKNETVAVKLFKSATLDEQDMSEFERELTLMTKLNHQNIICFYGACVQSKIGIVMEYCPNGSLASLIKNKTILTWKKKLQILCDIAMGMRFLHQNNIIHRDLKCDNVLLDAHFNAKITDFGVSKSKSDERMTKAIGTAYYCAPEVTLGEFYDESADVFSFGIIMFEVLVETLNPYNSSSLVQMKVATNPTYRPLLPDSFMLRPDQTFFVELMQDCWKHGSKSRPTFAQICTILKDKLEAE